MRMWTVLESGAVPGFQNSGYLEYGNRRKGSEIFYSIRRTTIIYLISFFPNCVTADASNSTNTSTAAGRNGNRENANVFACAV